MSAPDQYREGAAGAGGNPPYAPNAGSQYHKAAGPVLFCTGPAAVCRKGTAYAAPQALLNSVQTRLWASSAAAETVCTISPPVIPSGRVKNAR